MNSLYTKEVLLKLKENEFSFYIFNFEFTISHAYCISNYFSQKKGTVMPIDYSKELNDELDILQNKLKYIEKQKSRFPEGSLVICAKTAGNVSYYRNLRSDDNTIKEYLPKKKGLDEIKALANKDYLLKLEATIKKQIKAIEYFSKNYSRNCVYSIYNDMHPARKKLVTPLFLSPDQYAKQWNEAEYKKNESFPEGLRFQTDKGDFVRSKSEVIIANYLHSNRDKIFYRYEAPLYLEKPYQLTMHPDFTIISRSTGKIVYLEHCGMMDDSQYANDFVRKMNTYISNGLIPGVDVILTAETSSQPLAIQALWAQIARVLAL